MKSAGGTFLRRSPTGDLVPERPGHEETQGGGKGHAPAKHGSGTRRAETDKLLVAPHKREKVLTLLGASGSVERWFF